MKLKTQSQLAGMNRSAKLLSIGGLIGWALLTSSATAQDSPTGFESGSLFVKPASAANSLIADQNNPAIVVTSTGNAVDQPEPLTTVWEPPVTPDLPVPAAPKADWSPPRTTVQTPAAQQKVESFGQSLRSATSVRSSQEEAAPNVSPEEFDTSSYSAWNSLGGTQRPVAQTQEYATPDVQYPRARDSSTQVSSSQVLSSPAVEPLPSEVPQIPNTPDTLSTGSLSPIEAANRLLSPLSLPMDAVSGFDDSAVANEVIDPSSELVESFEVTDLSTASVGALAGAPTVTPVRNILGGVSSRLAGDESVFASGQLTFLAFSRDYRGNGRSLSNGIPNLSANGPDEGDFTGVDVNYGRRKMGGKGWEMRFMGFDPDAATDVSSSGPGLVWGGIVAPLTDPNTPATFGLSGIGLNGFSMADIFEDAAFHRVTRDSQFGSFEFNLLRACLQASQVSSGNSTVEFFGGLRAVTFDETLTFTAGGTQSAAFPRTATYSSEVNNALFGIQVGGRLERQLSKGWGYTFGTRVGIYNNRVESRQSAGYSFDDGSSATPQVLFGGDAGREFDFSGKDNELAFLGELDFGAVYQFRPRTRARVGFRGIAVTNVADAAGQFEDDLFDVDAVAEPKAFSDLIVGGFYFGVDHAF